MNTIQAPIMLDAQRINDSWTMLPSYLPVPDRGLLAVNSFLLKDGEPMLVDTGLAALGGEWFDALRMEIDADDLRWIWLSHMDADHIGNLPRVLDWAPRARVVTTFLGMGKMRLMGFDLSRVEPITPGARFDKVGRSLIPVRPPYFDAPESVGFLDEQDGVFFAVDSFGALLDEPATNLASIDEGALRDGLQTWSAIDAPWLGDIDRSRFAAMLAALRQIRPESMISAHLPAARDGVERLSLIVEDVWCRGSRALDPLALPHVVAGLQSEAMTA